MKALTFFGGIHPAYNKERTASLKIEDIEAPDEIIIPVSQHIGAPSTPCVAKGDPVLMGQLIAASSGFVSANIHSSVSGTVKAIEPRPGQMGVDVLSIIIENDHQYTQAEFKPVENWETAEPKELVNKINECGIVGMGGATFPSHVKLSPPPSKPIGTVILNGAECEPYLTSDHRVMVEYPQKVVSGLKIILKILGAKTGIIGIEENKPDAITAIEKECKGTEIKVIPLQVKYPQGGEKQLISAILNKEVPSGGLPMDVGVVVQNTGTAMAVFDAVTFGKPLFERVVTVTGSAVKKPGNFNIKIGTPVSTILEICEADTENMGKLVFGGPMMGFAQHNNEPSVIKGTSGILALDKKTSKIEEPLPCIRCGRCVTACPMNLLPAQLGAFSDNNMFDETEKLDAMDCMECGSCAHECPSQIPLVQKIRLAKSQIILKHKKEQGK
ncbi:MAG: electron transport complex subunit RsxC [Deltaproteobacteria bacterium]|nr:electron transport complex subunit RsxC [Deltaproteobacteria bacterium]